MKNNFGLEFVWGFCKTSVASLHTLNDIDLIFDTEIRRYLLGVETIYLFETVEEEINYYTSLVKQMENWIREENYSLNGKSRYKGLLDNCSHSVDVINHLTFVDVADAFATLKEVVKLRIEEIQPEHLL